MQVNLLQHPDAFPDLRTAFDPLANVAYGARFLAALRERTGSWERAVERYHSAEPGVGGPYRERVEAIRDGTAGSWPSAGGAGLFPVTVGPSILAAAQVVPRAALAPTLLAPGRPTARLLVPEVRRAAR
jgi:hypothetical protein